METYKEEIHYFNSLRDEIDSRAVFLSDKENVLIREKIEKLRSFQKEKPRIHNLLELLPLFFIFISFFFLFTFVKSSLLPFSILLIIFSIFHGVLSYQFVVYTLHQGAGHGLLRPYKILNRVCFNLSRILFADPIYYKKRHSRHHNHLGSEKDGAFTHFVLPKRIILSMLPGAGILFKNDYKIAQDESFTKSMVLSLLVGLIFLSLQVILLIPVFGMFFSFLSLIILSPWIALILDRTRESVEHCGVLDDKKYGAKELGLSFTGLLVGGGPWGQPCHFSHHYAPELHWYQQISLHRFFMKNTSLEFLDFYGFNTNATDIIKETYHFYKNNWNEFKEIKIINKV